MKIAVFSDIHGNVPALEAILADVKTENIDKIIFLGDAIAIGPKPKECLDILMQNDIIYVLGNHELYYTVGTHIDKGMEVEEWEHQTWITKQLGKKYKTYLQSLPIFYNLESEGKTYSFSHFILARERGLFPFEEMATVKVNGPEMYVDLQNADYTFIGHEHKPFVVSKNNKHIIDVGSSGCTKDNKTHYTIFDTATGFRTTKEIFFDREKLLTDIIQTEYPDKKFLSKIFFGVEL